MNDDEDDDCTDDEPDPDSHDGGIFILVRYKKRGQAKRESQAKSRESEERGVY